MPLTATCEILTVAVPVLLSVTVCDCVVPSVTLPKASDAGFEASVPVDAVVAPEPLKATVVWASLASLLMIIEAVKFPAAFGVKVRLIEI